MESLENARIFFAQAVDALLAGNVRLAESLLRQADALAPDRVSILTNLSAALIKQQCFAEALPVAMRATSLDEGNTQALINVCVCKTALHDAAGSFHLLQQGLRQAPENPELWLCQASIHTSLKNHEAARVALDAAERYGANLKEVYLLRGTLFRQLRQLSSAASELRKALSVEPGCCETRANLAAVLQESKCYPEAAAEYAKVLDVQPEYPFVRGHLLHTRMLMCDWALFDDELSKVRGELNVGKLVAEPFGFQALSDDPMELRRCAEIFASYHYPMQATEWVRPSKPDSKLRIGYLCGEFRDQATSILMVEMLEQHDRDALHVCCFDSGWDDNSVIRRRIVDAVDEIVDISGVSDSAAAEAVVARCIDVLVNLNGYFGEKRQGVFALRPAPIQVNFLGFPGTIGAPYIDYIIADAHVLPVADHGAYTEAVVTMPDCYQVNDSQRKIAPLSLTRAGAGLPEDAFVFCCFNNNYKITPAIFDIWMRILSRVRGSVLWLLEDNQAVVCNLRHEATRRGVASDRIVFAPRLDPADHLARHALADLFLDTLPYNAHTTASDALWAGLPVLTCTGHTFPGRVAGSLLKTMGLDALVCSSLLEYEEKAVELAFDPEGLDQVKRQLGFQRELSPLFDAKRFARHMEQAFKTMRERYECGKKAESFAVVSLS